MGFFQLPLRVAIPMRRTALGPFVGFGAWLVALGVAFIVIELTGGDSSPALPLGAAAGSVCFGLAANLGTIALWNQRAGLCEACRTIRSLAKDHGDWFCQACGHPVSRLSLNRPSHASFRAPVVHEVPKSVHARKVPRGADDERGSRDSDDPPPP